MLRATNLSVLPHGFSTHQDTNTDGVLPGAPLVLARQIHSATVIPVSGRWSGPPPEADALVTDSGGLMIGVVTADCAPVLLADPVAGVVGAAHAGWRGALGGVIANTVTAMEALGARKGRIAAAIGPTIAQRSYEVDAVMRGRFPVDAHVFFMEGAAGRWQFDLPGFVGANLRQAGVRDIVDLGCDTYGDEGRFHSFRRSTHRGQPTGGRQISVIGIPSP